MLRFLLFQFLKKLIHRILKLFVILAGFACVDELQQRGEVLLLLRGFIPDVANQCTVEQPFCFDPEIFARLLAIPLCVGDNCIDQFQNILFAADVMERIVSHGFFEIDGVQDFDLIPGIREHLSTLDNDRTLRKRFVKIENGKVTNYFQFRNSPLSHHHALNASSCPLRCPCFLC